MSYQINSDVNKVCQVIYKKKYLHNKNNFRFEHDVLMRKKQNFVDFPLDNLDLSKHLGYSNRWVSQSCCYFSIHFASFMPYPPWRDGCNNRIYVCSSPYTGICLIHLFQHLGVCPNTQNFQIARTIVGQLSPLMENSVLFSSMIDRKCKMGVKFGSSAKINVVESRLKSKLTTSH